MHIPDGFVNIPVAAATYVASGGSLAYAVRRTNEELGEKQVPLMGVMGAFIFAVPPRCSTFPWRAAPPAT